MKKNKQPTIGHFFRPTIQVVASTSRSEVINDVEMGDVSPTQQIESSSSTENLVERVTTPVSFERDPAIRKSLNTIEPSTRDFFMREYLRLGPFQPILTTYPERGDKRKFLSAWFSNELCKKWIEYSPTTDKAYCLYCFLFPGDSSNQPFVQQGYNSWKHMFERNKGVQKHIGLHNSVHNQAALSCEDFLKHDQSIIYHLANQTDQVKQDNKTRTLLSIKVAKHLVLQGLSFRGHDESNSSLNRGNFIETLQFKVAESPLEDLLRNAPKNAKHTSPECQKDICRALSNIVQERILQELGEKFFAILIDECRDVSGKEWFVLVIRFVDDEGQICERVLDFITVSDTFSNTLFNALCHILHTHSLSISRIRGQAYDGASNMRGEKAGLQAKVKEVNPLAYYVHCCAHRLNLVVVDVCSTSTPINSFFYYIQTMHNLIANSPKSKDLLSSTHATNLSELLTEGTLESGKGQNQEKSIGTLSTTRWYSHYKGLINTKKLFDALCSVLKDISENSSDGARRAKADNCFKQINTLEFVFILHLMIKILESTHTLSQALQRQKQTLSNAASLIILTIKNIESFGESGFVDLLAESVTFCTSHCIKFEPLDEPPTSRGRPRDTPMSTRCFLFAIFENATKKCVDEMQRRFSTEQCTLMEIINALEPKNFGDLSIRVLTEVKNLFKSDFNDDIGFTQEATDFIRYVAQEEALKKLNGLEQFCQYMVKKNIKDIFPQIHKLVRILLTLPITTSTAERSFSSLKLIKTRLRSTMADDWATSQLISYINRDITKLIPNEDIYDLYVKSGPRRSI